VVAFVRINKGCNCVCQADEKDTISPQTNKIIIGCSSAITTTKILIKTSKPIYK
jgi:hypothetical protein